MRYNSQGFAEGFNSFRKKKGQVLERLQTPL